MNGIRCPYCPPDEEKALLERLAIGDEEYYDSLKTADGTRKWFKCPVCTGVYCRDKVKARWLYSPKTYDRFVKEGVIKNKLATNDKTGR